MARHADAMTAPTHATVATFSMDTARADEQKAALHAVIVPSVARAPGLVSAKWTARLHGSTRESVVFVTFVGEEAAETFASRVRANRADQLVHGIELMSITVLTIEASIDSVGVAAGDQGVTVQPSAAAGSGE